MLVFVLIVILGVSVFAAAAVVVVTVFVVPRNFAPTKMPPAAARITIKAIRIIFILFFLGFSFYFRSFSAASISLFESVLYELIKILLLYSFTNSIISSVDSTAIYLCPLLNVITVSVLLQSFQSFHSL